MKNVHLLSTDKPSRLWVNNLLQGKLELSELVLPCNTSQNIYITSDKKPKKGEWSIYLGLQKKYKVIEDIVGDEFPKIILTTDPDLIKDGVQAIPDEFLEWFIKNPSCEEVEVVDNLKYFNVDELRERHLKRLPHLYSEKIGYKIIIPKEEQKELQRKLLTLIESLEQEESKPHSFCETPNEKCTMSYCDENGCQNRKRILVEPKEETLEEEYYNDFKMIKGENIIEAAKRFWKESKANPIEMAIFGTKWQAEQNKNKFSEEEMLGFAWFLVKNIGQYSCDETAHFEGKYLEQFKNK